MRDCPAGDENFKQSFQMLFSFAVVGLGKIRKNSSLSLKKLEFVCTKLVEQVKVENTSSEVISTVYMSGPSK